MAVIKMNFLSQALGMQANVTVCLPSFSFKDIMEKREDVYVQGMKYQVLWLLHGGTGDDSDYVNFTNITRFADDHKLAVVMPADYNAWYEDLEQGAKYQTYVAEELPKMMRAIFPFSDKPEDNFIGGLSMGGMGTEKILANYPENYSAALIMSSGAALYGDTPRQGSANLNMYDSKTDPKELREKWLKNLKEGKMPKIFLTCGGDDHLIELNKWERDWMMENGFDVTWEEVPGYKHEWDFWDLTLRKTIREWFPIRHAVLYPEAE